MYRLLLALVCAACTSLAAQESTAPPDDAVVPPSLTWSLVPDDQLLGPGRPWVLTAASASLAGGVAWAALEVAGMVKPLLALLATGDLSTADQTLAAIPADAEFQRHVFGFAFSLIATGFVSSALDQLVHQDPVAP